MSVQLTTIFFQKFFLFIFSIIQNEKKVYICPWTLVKPIQTQQFPANTLWTSLKKNKHKEHDFLQSEKELRVKLIGTKEHLYFKERIRL